MLQLIDRTGPERVVFSSAGLREGLMLHRRRKKQRKRDPLLAVCTRIGRSGARQRMTPDTLMAWVSALGLGLSPAEERIAEAACRLVDIAGMEHPSYRAEHAFMRAFRLPAVAIEHTERAFLGLVMAARYDGRVDRDWTGPARTLIAEDARNRALSIGLALRLAMTLAPGIEGAQLRRKSKTLALPYTGTSSARKSNAGWPRSPPRSTFPRTYESSDTSTRPRFKVSASSPRSRR